MSDLTGELQAIRAEISSLREELAANSRPLDAKALQERGYTRDESYQILRAAGYRTPGGRRKRIHPEALAQFERQQT